MIPSTTKSGLSHEDEIRSLQTGKDKGGTCVQMAEGKRTPRRGSQTLIQGETELKTILSLGVYEYTMTEDD